jgi:hypothetical protein
MNFKKPSAGVPHLNEFFVRGVSLGVALKARAQWASLSELEREALGFSVSQVTPAISFEGFPEKHASRLN